ncbi:MAG TPA: DUF1998 domain-containing protein [Burkholderiaceae bacterium]|nr:DUF1998 domain-containing protein [Burkholderiaceae bacterium]
MAISKKSGPAPEGVEPLGTVRRSQLISTYGIGGIIDLDKGSFMPMGLEDWERVTSHPALRITEGRLQAQLDVDHFRMPPVVKPIRGTPMVELKSTAPAVRFPEWHECPKCHRIGTEGDPFELCADNARLQCTNPKCGKAVTTPVRFVVACRHGHIDEFPWVWWAHRSRDGGSCAEPRLKLLSHGKSASLGDLYVKCTSCDSASTLGDAFSADSMVKATCSGSRPWLYDRERDCKEKPRVLQRGASNIHFPVVASALSIPPVTEVAYQIVEHQWIVLGAVPADAIAGVLAGIAPRYGLSVEALMAAFRERKKLDDPSYTATESSSRAEEYSALSSDREPETTAGFASQFCNTVMEPPAKIAHWFDLIGAVSRLREVRALAGFTRIEPYPVASEQIGQAIKENRISRLSKRPSNWLPATEIKGEGIFLRFRTEAIDQWMEDNPALAERISVMESRSAQIASEKGYKRDYTITARLLLVHSFAHALIRQISVACGYSSSALRERLYIAEPSDGRSAMNGVLVYTGSPDSEGSLGGLVRLAEPKLLEKIVLETIRNAGWCGSDPVCLETDPRQSGDRLSGAACHCCLLVPETACEKFNRELDRTMLIGDAQGKWNGFFATGGE